MFYVCPYDDNEKLNKLERYQGNDKTWIVNLIDLSEKEDQLF